MTERNVHIMIQPCVATAERLRYNVSRCNVYTLFDCCCLYTIPLGPAGRPAYKEAAAKPED